MRCFSHFQLYLVAPHGGKKTACDSNDLNDYIAIFAAVYMTRMPSPSIYIGTNSVDDSPLSTMKEM